MRRGNWRILLVIPALHLMHQGTVQAQINNTSSGNTSYLPVAPGIGGFLPYNPSPAVINNPRGMSAGYNRTNTGTMMPGAMTPTLGGLRTNFNAIAPIGASPSGMSRSGGLGLMGAGSSMIQRSPKSGGPPARMSRPPVGFYPFKIPGSLASPSSGISMSM